MDKQTSLLLVQAERLMKKMSKLRKKSFDGRQKVVSRKNAPSSPVGIWIQCMDHPLKDSLQKQVRPNELDEYGLSPLHRACEMGHTTRVKFLLALGADVNLPTDHNQGDMPALVCAAANGHARVVRLLIHAGACVNDGDCWNNTALFKAASYNHVQCVQELLKEGANPNACNKWGALPLQYAAMQGHCEVVTMLLDAGADVNLCLEKNVPPPLVGASMRGHYKCVQEILKYNPNIDITFQDKTNTAVYLALKHFLLFCNGYDTHMSNASSNDRFQCVHLLLAAGASVSLQCLELTYGSDQLIPYLVTEEYILLIKMLLRAFPYTTETCFQSFSSLFAHATRLGQFKWELVRLICSTGFKPLQTHLRQLDYTFMDNQQQELYILSHNPSSLLDICRSVIRKNIQSVNVISAVSSLPLPNLLKDYIALNNSASYVI